MPAEVLVFDSSKRLIGWVAAVVAVAACAQPVLADTVLITGANSGIGLEFVKQYAAKGWTVIATHRRSGVPESLAEVIKDHKNVRVEKLDVTSADDLKALVAKLNGEPIDLLINNAGVYNDRSKCHDDDCPGDWSTQSLRRPALRAARHDHGREREGPADGVRSAAA